jgi:hypothetical protein
VTLRHVLAVLGGVLAFALVYTYTGDADLMVAPGSGAGWS